MWLNRLIRLYSPFSHWRSLCELTESGWPASKAVFSRKETHVLEFLVVCFTFLCSQVPVPILVRFSARFTLDEFRRWHLMVALGVMPL